jgi:hypothetical protein
MPANLLITSKAARHDPVQYVCKSRATSSQGQTGSLICLQFNAEERDIPLIYSNAGNQNLTRLKQKKPDIASV